MPIIVTPPSPPPLTQEDVDEVMRLAEAHCAPSTWDKFVKSLKANKFPFAVK